MRFSIIALSLLAAAVAAHHSTVGIFDADNYVEIAGIVTSAQWRNPHATYTVAVTDSAGETVEWDVETASITTLRMRGVDPDMIEVGDRVRFAGESSMRGLPEMFARNMLLDNGEEVLLSAGSVPRWPAGLRGDIFQPTVDEAAAEESRRSAEGIFRVWTTVLNNPESFPLYRGGGLPLTESARALKAQFDPTTSPYLGCDPRGMPYQMTTPYPFEFERRGEDIVFVSELHDAERVIHMNAEPSPTEPYSLLGYSIGRWEGSTLVVETDRIDAPYFYGDGTPQTRAIELVERFTLNEAEDRLDYTLTVTDPETFTETLNFTKYWAWKPDVRREPYNCVD